MTLARRHRFQEPLPSEVDETHGLLTFLPLRVRDHEASRGRGVELEDPIPVRRHRVEQQVEHEDAVDVPDLSDRGGIEHVAVDDPHAGPLGRMLDRAHELVAGAAPPRVGEHSLAHRGLVHRVEGMPPQGAHVQVCKRLDAQLVNRKVDRFEPGAGRDPLLHSRAGPHPSKASARAAIVIE